MTCELMSQEPTGQFPGSGSPATLLGIMRGYHGEDDIYWLQFSASLRGSLQMIMHSLLLFCRSYRKNGCHLNISGYVHLPPEWLVTLPKSTFPLQFFVHMYDGGNNILVEDTEHRTVSVRSSGFPSLTISRIVELRCEWDR